MATEATEIEITKTWIGILCALIVLAIIGPLAYHWFTATEEPAGERHHARMVVCRLPDRSWVKAKDNRACFKYTGGFYQVYSSVDLKVNISDDIKDTDDYAVVDMAYDSWVDHKGPQRRTVSLTFTPHPSGYEPIYNTLLLKGVKNERRNKELDSY